MALNKEIQMATQQVLTKIPPLTEGSLGILFLQMTVDDLGICLPMNPLTQVCSQIVYGIYCNECY